MRIWHIFRITGSLQKTSFRLEIHVFSMRKFTVAISSKKEGCYFQQNNAKYVRLSLLFPVKMRYGVFSSNSCLQVSSKVRMKKVLYQVSSKKFNKSLQQSSTNLFKNVIRTVDFSEQSLKVKIEVCSRESFLKHVLFKHLAVSP